MVSGGFRVGAWDYLRWGDIKPIYQNKRGETSESHFENSQAPTGDLVASSVKVYAGTNDEYLTFNTPEANLAVKAWMDSRSKAGEKVTPKSWVMRDFWEEIQTTKGGIHQRGMMTVPKQLTATGIMRLIQRALVAQGIRTKLEAGKHRHEFQADHGFRKFFNTVCDNRMKMLFRSKGE